MSDPYNPDEVKRKAFEQFVRRKSYAEQVVKIDEQGLHAGSPIYHYCEHCGVPTEVLPEAHLWEPYKFCSQCAALVRNGLLEEAIQFSKGEGVDPI